MRKPWTHQRRICWCRINLKQLVVISEFRIISFDSEHFCMTSSSAVNSRVENRARLLRNLPLERRRQVLEYLRCNGAGHGKSSDSCHSYIGIVYQHLSTMNGSRHCLSLFIVYQHLSTTIIDHSHSQPWIFLR